MVVVVDRYRAAGLTGNPFAAATAIAPPTRFVDRGLPDPPPPGSATLVQVIGDKGAGKTTHVTHWRSRVDGPYHYVPRRPYRARYLPPPVGPIVYADEIDRMPLVVRRRWFGSLASAGATVVAGTHRDLTRPATRAGLRVVTHRLGPASPETLHEFVTGRLQAASAQADAIGPVIDALDLGEVHHRSQGNLRAAESMLHEAVARWVEVRQPPSVPLEK